jgi:hypothetical protein
LFKKGWDKTREVKAAALCNDRKYGKEAVKGILDRLVVIDSLKINYIVVNKEGIINERFKKAPYGIAYNYFTGELLKQLIFTDKFYEANLTYDKRNKETHANKPFIEYLNTLILGESFENNINAEFKLQGNDSNKCYGLLAADFFSWSLFRKYEFGDDGFCNLFSHKIGRKIEWYIIK